jgi:hypothetical protein
MKRILLLLASSFSQVINAQEVNQPSPIDSNGKAHTLTEVTFSASANKIKENIAATQMGKVDLPVSMLAKVPTIAGEPDVIKAMQLTPGVKQGTEGSIGTYVRGGGKDENLILMDGAPVYNAGHLLGFFSVFNTSVVKDVQLFKSSFPSQYGGRLSSVMDITTKDGSMYNYKGSASLGLISSSVSFQGPITKEKLSFMLSGRRTYADKIIKYIPYYFYDVNGKLTYKLNDRHKLYFSVFNGNDVMDLEHSGKDSAKGNYTLKSGMNITNSIASLRWSHNPSGERYTTDVTAYYTGFRYSVDGKIANNSLSMRSSITDIGIKGHLKWKEIEHHNIETGFSYAYHYFNPNIIHTRGAALDQYKSSEGRKIYNHEMAIYLQDDISLSSKWQVNTGIRLSAATTAASSYINPEPRVGVRYLVNDHSSLKASYARMAQYMHLVSSSSLTLPTDLWYPSTADVKPGLSDQVSAGYYYAFPDMGIQLSGEVYYKWLRNVVEYKEGALLVMNDEYEKELLRGKGRSYGLELFAGKTTGRFTGWVGYSLAYASRQFDSLNDGREYYARYDRRHDISVVALYNLYKRWTINTVIQYATGTPFTGQQSQYVVPKPDFTGVDILPVYTSRNALRLSSSFRIDLDLGYKFTLSKRIKGDAHFSVYNLLNRTQPYTVQRVYDQNKKTYVYEQKGLFGTIPSFSINLNF